MKNTKKNKQNDFYELKRREIDFPYGVLGKK